MAVLFSSGFESGDFTGWFGQDALGTGSSVAVQSAIKRSGNYAGIFTVGSPWGLADTSKSGLASSIIYLKGYIMLANLPALNSYQQLSFFELTTAGWTEIAHIGVANQGADYKIQYENIPEGIIYYSNPITIQANVWHYVEVYFKKGTTDGEFAVWLDSIQVLSQIGKNTGTADVNAFRVGMIYPDIIGTVYVDDVEFSNVPPANGQLSVTATLDGSPVGATITVGGQTGTSPTTFTLSPNTYTVTATYGGQTLTQTVVVVSGETTIAPNFAFTSIPQQAYITVNANVGGVPVSASVTVDGLSGTTPVTFTVVPAQSYTVSATFSGQTLTQTVTLANQETRVLNFAFTPANGFINVTATSNGISIPANVTADGQSGITPVMFSFLPGTYTLTASYGGVTLPSQAITIVAGQIVQVNFTFAPSTITLTVIDATPTSGTYIVGSTYQFTPATPPSGFSFDHWDLGGSSKGSTVPLTLTITPDMDGQTLTAIFTQTPPQQVQVTIAVLGNGTTDISTGPQMFTVGETVKITAIAKAGATFIEWKLDNVSYSTENPLNLVVTADLNGKTLTADFMTPIQAGFPLWMLAIPIGAVGIWYFAKNGKHKKKR